MKLPKPSKPAKIRSLSQSPAPRRTGSAMAKALGSGAHVAMHSSTHIKSRMKRFT